VELVKLLLEEGCSASAYNALTQSTPLHMAVRRRSLEIVTLLLEYGADPLLQDKVSPSTWSCRALHTWCGRVWRCILRFVVGLRCGIALGVCSAWLAACEMWVATREYRSHTCTELQYTVHGTVHETLCSLSMLCRVEPARTTLP
jgi:hypothetical protein